MNDRGQVFGHQLPPENMTGKEKVSDTEEVEPICEDKFPLNSTASTVEQTTLCSEHEVPQTKAKPVRRQTQSGPLSSGIVLINSDSEKGHGYERFAIS